MVVGVDLLDGEQVGGDELPDLPPVLAVGGEGDVGGPVHEVVEERGRRPRGEDVVVRPQDRLRRARRGHHEVRDGAEADEHEPAVVVLGGEVTEGDVRAVADEEQVADDGKRPRRGRRELPPGLVVAAAAEGTTAGGGEQQQHASDDEQE